ncbi:hypothetical protein HPB51_023998 [Rhipicephalus microplus]|uniref:PDEase domain-containing protein n=1 Tax=Rhipicephalus microplus TaxID=6941 RepID=A0A9J6EDQ7_RHIMP|nr:hypothetical protein HPB51_023998 [Rhipicephalus microplus]
MRLRIVSELPQQGSLLTSFFNPLASSQRFVGSRHGVRWSVVGAAAEGPLFLHDGHPVVSAVPARGTRTQDGVQPPPAEPCRRDNARRGGGRGRRLADQQATLPSVRRLHTSDYDSSNDSPSGSDTNDPASGPNVLEGALRSPQQATAVVATATTAATTAGPVRCGLCGARVGATLAARPRERRLEDATGAKGDEDSGSGNEGDFDREEGGGLYVGDTLFLPDEIVRDPLLGRIAEWDYPIFDLNRLNPDTILSKMCYRVFLEVGLFDAFKIPEPEFLHYFHALESGYREKPYHNRMHAADVLHGVYYLTSQAIPGFVQAVPDTTDFAASQDSRELLSSCGLFCANIVVDSMMECPFAVLYNDRSVLENYHAASAWTLFLSEPKFNFLVHLDKAEFKRFRFLVIECILATDLKRHFEILAEFNAKCTSIHITLCLACRSPLAACHLSHFTLCTARNIEGVTVNARSRRALRMFNFDLEERSGASRKSSCSKCIAVHVSDVAILTLYLAPNLPKEQGDEEATLGMQVSPFMDRCNPQLAKLQESFINHLVAPLCNAYGEACLLPGHWVEASDSEDEG